MKRIITAFTGLFLASLATAQTTTRVGLGTITPLARLHVSGNDSVGLLINNTTPLNAGVANGLAFKTGGLYTGRIRTYGTGTVFSNMGFFTYASADSSALYERMTITDAGLVGIGITTPLFTLDVNGNGRFTGNLVTGGTLNVTGNTTLAGNTTVGSLGASTLSTTGNASIGGTLGVTGNSVLSTLSATGNAGVGGALNVAGSTTTAGLIATGTVQLAAGSPASGKVLTATSTSGTATWQAPALPVTANSAFIAGISTFVTIPNSSSAYTFVPFKTTASGGFDDAGAFNNTTSMFSAPAAGVYHFDVAITTSNNVGGMSSAATSNGNVIIALHYGATNEVFSTPLRIGDDYFRDYRLSTNLKLSAGELVYVEMEQFVAGTLYANYYGCKFTGYRLY